MTPLETVKDAALDQAGIRLLIKRDDLTASHLMGNKARKLKYNLQAACTLGHTKLATFGGAYSNHIYATAAAGKIHGFDTFGFIRGEEHLPLNPVLAFATRGGMRLFYIDRDFYRQKNSAVMADYVRQRCGEVYVLPEGGSNALAVKGCMEIVPEIQTQLGSDCDVIAVAMGTGATLAGVIRSLKPTQRALGFSALKNGEFLKRDVVGWLDGEIEADWSICSAYAGNGYAKTTPELLTFIDRFTQRTGIPLDPVYTGKMMFGLYDQIVRGDFARGATLVALHSGGYVPSFGG